ncbi:MAG: GH3 auxin-responsive promoter family protein [Alphaproteobacteria bacterium]|nr:GH3 auxin-responsive promoter family protein [Alphaproteobacteria bacterium]
MLDATPLLRLYARRRLGRLRKQDPVAVQQRQLLSLVAKARDTRFGRDHRFGEIATVEDFQARVPLRSYDAFWSEYWEPAFPTLTDSSWPGRMPYFAVTSGTTTGTTKYIPCSREMTVSNKWAGGDILVHHIANRPQSRLFGGRSFMLGGSTDLKALAPGVLSGDLSAIAAKEMPWWVRLRYFPPRALERITDWEEKIEALARASLAEDIRMISDTPSWLLIYFDRLAALRPDMGGRLAAVFPNLELLVHGGVNFAPYRKTFQTLLAGSRAETREVYPASEGFVAVADRGDGEGLRLVLDTGLFFEFVPVEEMEAPAPARHWMATAEPGVNYALVLSTCAGLWAYVLGDTVELLTRDPPRVLVTGRISYSLSAFGEHLIDAEIEEAVSAAADAIGSAVTDYSVAPIFAEETGRPGGHVYIVEFAPKRPNAAAVDRFARLLDKALRRTNEDYDTHRAGDFGMAPPQVEAVVPGSFAAWMKARGRLGGQHKVPRIINDPELFKSLRDFAAGHPDPGGGA